MHCFNKQEIELSRVELSQSAPEDKEWSYFEHFYPKCFPSPIQI